ncbi:LamG-like jellyroll fold domain-containing protein [Flavobacterium sp.]|uniref:LamG-like jellyroll fold domain-containing protein n=1 Tax=Flavobacterium sp. TaxID=239 RepID=UPI0037511122
MKKLLHFLVLFFVIGIANAQTPIYQFDFDGNTNSSGTGTFNGFTNTGAGIATYVNNRLGQTNEAINIPNNLTFAYNGVSANAPSLPVVNSARTLSFWVKFINDTDDRTYMPVGWGTSSVNQAFGFWRNGVQNTFYTWGAGNDYNVPQNNSQIQATNNGWVHIAMTHNGTTLTIYYNGVDVGNYPRTLNTFGPSDLTLNRFVNNGNSATGVALQLDDLKIYNTALTGTQIASLYSTNTTGTTPAMPTITNVSATNIGNTTATINYTVNANNAATTTEIRYGTSPGGTLQTQTGGNASGTTPTLLSVSLTGLTPNTTYDYNVWAFNSEGTSFLNSSLTFTTTGSTAVPVITSVNASNITNTAATINFDVNTNGIASPTNIFYGTSASALTSSASGPVVTSNSATNHTINLSSLTPNTIYYYYVRAINANGQTASAVNQFTTLATPAQPTPVYHYKFSGNLNEENGGPALNYEANSGTYSFVIGNSALASSMSGNQTPNFSASLPNLPQGASARTVSIRLNIEVSETFSFQNNIFAWGTPTANQAYGWSQINATQGRNYFWGSGDYTFSNTINPGTWYTITFVYDGTDAKVYKDGVFLSSTPRTLNTTGTNFWLGSVLGGTQNYFNGFMDDLQIYNSALTTAQIASLNGAILSNEDFNSNNLKFSLYPNPATDILNIDLESEFQSVEFYSLQGQKVLTSNLKVINVSSLASGLYMVRVQNNVGTIATKKLMIK